MIKQIKQKQTPFTQPSKEKVEKSKGSEEVENLKAQLARCLADYDNLKKRSEEERGTMYKLASISFMTKLLPIIDNLRSAQNHVNDSGIAIIIGQLETLAKDEGFGEINLKVGDPFDHEVAEVVEAIETEKEKDNNMISEVVLSGWKYSDGSVVRHARVKVFKTKAKEQNNTENSEEETKEEVD